MEKLTDDETHQLALMFEIASRLAGACRIKNDFLHRRRQERSYRLVVRCCGYGSAGVP